MNRFIFPWHIPTRQNLWNSHGVPGGLVINTYHFNWTLLFSRFPSIILSLSKFQSLLNLFFCIHHIISRYKRDLLKLISRYFLFTQDVNKSGKNFQMKFVSLPAHENLTLTQYEDVQSIIELIWQIREIFNVEPFEGPYITESQTCWHPELITISILQNDILSKMNRFC